MATISKRSLLLALIGIGNGKNLDDSLGGITRIQKLLFLLEREENVNNNGGNYEFEPYKAGPYSASVYDDLEFLENLGFIMSTNVGSPSKPERAELKHLTLESLINPKSDEEGGADYEQSDSSDSYEERRFVLTEKGRDKISQLLMDNKYNALIDSVRKVKTHYSHYSLNDLLYYVYTRYPEMATESEIKDKVLKKQQRRFS